MKEIIKHRQMEAKLDFSDDHKKLKRKISGITG